MLLLTCAADASPNAMSHSWQVSLRLAGCRAGSHILNCSVWRKRDPDHRVRDAASGNDLLHTATHGVYRDRKAHAAVRTCAVKQA